MDRARAAQKNSTVTSLGIAPGSTSQPVLAPTPTNSPLTTGPPVGGPVSAVASDTVQPSATVPNITASHDPPAPESSNAPLPAPTLDPPGVAHTVTDAQMAQSGGHSEMRIAMQSDNLGNIELRASVSGNSIGANITVEKRDAHTALAMELPALQQALSDKQLRVEQISLLHGSLPAAGGDTAAQHSPGQNQGGQRPPQNFPSAPPSAGASGFYAATGFSADVGEIFDAQGRLSVLA